MTTARIDRPSRRRRLAVTGAVVAVLLGVGIAAVPLLVDTEAVKRAVERQVSETAGGEVRYESISVHLFPQIRAEISGAAIRIPGVVEGRIAALDVRIAWLPLLMGDIRPAAIRVERPSLEVRIEPGEAGDPFAAYRAALGPVVEMLAREARGMTLTIAGGKLDIVYAGQPLVSLSELEAEADVSAKEIVATVSSSADLWSTAQGRLKIAPGSLAASAKVQVSGLRVAELLDALLAERALRVRPGAVEASLDAETDGRSAVRAALTASTSQLVVARGARTLDLGALRIAADAARDGQAATITLGELQLGTLLPGATGSLRARANGAAPALELKVPVLDLARVRDAALKLAGDVDAVGTAVAAVTAGTVRGLTFSTTGDDFASFTDPQALRAEATLEGIALALPAVGISVKNGAGRIVLAEGTVQGSELAGGIGKSSFSAGKLAAELLPKVSLRSLQATFDADLAGTLAIARDVLGHRRGAVISDIESLQGRASGSVTYEARPGNSRIALNVAKLRGSGRYRGVPYPLEVSQCELSYTGEHLAVRGLSGSVGRSRVQGGSVEIALGAELAVRAASADAVLALDELYPWLASLDGPRTALGGMTGVSGTAVVSLARLSGPLTKPASLDFEFAVQPKQVRLSVPALPGPLTFPAGTARVTPRTLRIEHLQAAVLDARVTASGTVENYASSDRHVDLTLADGSAGQKTIDWAHKRWQLPEKSVPRAPVALAAGRLEWTGGGRGPLVAQGAAGLAGGARAEFDVTWQPGALDLRRFAVKDADSDVTVALKWAPGTVGVSFSGNADNRTLVRILAHPPKGRGQLHGDFRASLDLDAPSRSTSTGTVEGEGLDILERWGFPVAIERLRLEAAGQSVRIHDTLVRIGGEPLTVSGTVAHRQKTFSVDAQIAADALNAERLLGVFTRGGPPGKPRTKAAWNLPVEGRVTVAAKSIAYGGRVFQPVAATVSLAPNRVVAEVTDARLCGIALPLTVALAPGSANVSVRLQARSQPLEQAVSCLAGAHLAITGTFDLDAEFAASGPADALLRAARGSFRFATRAGRIHRAAAVSRTLAVDEVATRLRAAPSDLMAGGFEYEEIAVAGALEAGRVRLDHATLDSPALGVTMSGEIGIADHSIALQGLVAPLDNISRVVKRVPIVGRVLGTSLVVIPVNVTGDLRDPKVTVLKAAAVGASLINLMTTTFKAPIELLDPLAGQPQRPRQ